MSLRRRSRARPVLLASLRQHPRALVGLMVWSMVEAVPTLLLGRSVAGVTDGFVSRDFARGAGWLAVLVLAALVGAVGSRQVYPRVAVLVEAFRDELVRLVVGGALHRSTTGAARLDTAAAARLTHQVEIVRDTYAGILMVARSFVFSAAGALLGMLTLMPVVFALVLPPLVVGLGLFLGTVAALARRQREYVLSDERVAESASSVANGLRDIVACGAEGRLAASVGAHIDAQADATRGLARIGAARSLALAVGGWLPVVLVLTGAPWLVRHGASVGAILGTLTYISFALQPALHTLVHGLAGSGLRLMVTLTRIVETGETPQARRQSRTRSPRHMPPERKDIQLHSVTFAYGTSAQPVIEDLDLTIPAGDHLAVVGPSGIGKSTLAGLLTGVLEPSAGAVCLGGTPICQLDPDVWTRCRVLIPQEAYVFTGSILENLTYLRPDATWAEVVKATELVGLNRLIERLEGYDTEINPASLSTGERQLIALVRAYLSPAPIIVLDEATCHLDPVAEARAETAFAARPGTLIVVAHRMSSALRARRILLMDGTRVVLGTHDHLMAASPLYRDLVGDWQTNDEHRTEPTLTSAFR